MPDLVFAWGGDLATGPSGDLALADGTALGMQRVLRRLLTTGGGYIWHTGYGAGLAAAVGGPAAPLRIEATIRSQLFAEPAVAAAPQPAVQLQSNADGRVYVQLRYTDAATAQTQLLAFDIDG